MPSWQSVTEFDGDYTGAGRADHADTTDAFSVIGTKFRLKWMAVADGEYVSVTDGQVPAKFRVYVHREGVDRPVVSVEDKGAHFWDGTPRSGEAIVSRSWILSRSGRFYLEVRVTNIESWVIEVHEWR